METTREAGNLLAAAMELAASKNHEYITPEHFLLVLCQEPFFQELVKRCGGEVSQLQADLELYLAEHIDCIEGQTPQVTQGFEELLTNAHQQTLMSGKTVIEIQHLLRCLLDLEESFAVYYLQVQGIDLTDLLVQISHHGSGALAAEQAVPPTAQPETSGWRQYVECFNDKIDGSNPLIGRQAELERTIQILCRKEKNNPLHIGEPGVGKTAITLGLAERLSKNQVPDRLKGAEIFAVDLGGLLAGTQYRGDFEKRFQEIMAGIATCAKPIVYFDEIHNIVGAGAVGGGSLDISNMLKPYLTDGRIRFIGATTYEEYKKYFAQNKSLIRRFQNIDVKEPSQDEAVAILSGLKRYYEKFHGVKYAKGVLEYAVAQSSKFINERYLPDKAIDLMDEAGAYRQLHPLSQKVQTVNRQLIDMMLAKICNVPEQRIEDQELKQLAQLDKRLLAVVYGQDEAVVQVVNAVRFARAGLLEEGKPLASLLFVGPTGVGKTEVANTLAKELAIPLLRFDMSEYAEKHAVAKLIGSPAGYVGYEEGGLLTEAIRKNPHAVLLLDEIEKAHGDIYNILLPVMDYATLTDNQGRKADFRNVIIIMTSNAGASQMIRERIGFGSSPLNQDAMMDEVKRIFQPEFRNRLNKIVTFRFMDEMMAQQITNKKLRALAEQLDQRKVVFEFTRAAADFIMQKGISKEYGAREIDRVINQEVKPLLVDRLLFGKLKRGGQCCLDLKDGGLWVKEQIVKMGR